MRAHVIEAGLKSGDRLPAERTLATELGVSRASVRQAIVALGVQGLVEVRHGGGSYLRQDDLEPQPFSQLIDRRQRLPDILDAREALEVKLAELAATRRSDSDIEAIWGALEVMKESIEAKGIGEDGDAAFHRAITAAARSHLLARLMDELADDITTTRHESLSQVGRPLSSLAQHRAIAHAITRGDPDGARTAMRGHLRNVANVKILAWTPPES